MNALNLKVASHRVARPAFRRVAVIAVAAAVVAFGGTQAQAQGVPVISVAELAQDVAMAASLVQQVETMKSQLTTMNSQLTAMTNNSGVGQIMNSSSLHSYLPDDWNSVYSGIQSGNLSTLSSSASQLAAQEGLTSGSAGETRVNNVLVANKAINEQALNATLARLTNIQSLMTQINGTQDVLCIQAVLQIRLNAENAMIQNEQSRMNIMSKLQDDELALARKQSSDTFNGSMGQ